MAKNKKIGGLVHGTNLDQWLSSTGYLYPRNEFELDVFEKLYSDYEFKLKDKSIDTESIVNGVLKCQTRKYSSFAIDNEQEIQELKMAARKGEQTIPKDILDKMKSKHKNGDK